MSTSGCHYKGQYLGQGECCCILQGYESYKGDNGCGGLYYAIRRYTDDSEEHSRQSQLDDLWQEDINAELEGYRPADRAVGDKGYYGRSEECGPPAEMQRAIAKQAEAEREEGQNHTCRGRFQASQKLADAAKIAATKAERFSSDFYRPLRRLLQRRTQQ